MVPDDAATPWRALYLAAFTRNSLTHEDYLGHLRTCADHRRRRDLCGRGNDNQFGRSRGL
jgi:hypothetical protein